jgi:hypothetical protein
MKGVHISRLPLLLKDARIVALRKCDNERAERAEPGAVSGFNEIVRL